MPFSHYHQLNEIVKLIMATNPQSILDVGVGFGAYGYLSRLYLEFSDGREKYGDWQRRIDGIEVFEQYLTPMHQQIYNQIYIGEALGVLPTLKTRYDLVLLIDVLEHFTRERGMKLLELSLERGRNVIVSTPNKFWSQQEAFGNPFETHHSIWRRGDFAKFHQKFFLPNDYSLICYLGEDAARIHRFILKQKIYSLSNRFFIGEKTIRGLLSLPGRLRNRRSGKST